MDVQTAFGCVSQKKGCRKFNFKCRHFGVVLPHEAHIRDKTEKNPGGRRISVTLQFIKNVVELMEVKTILFNQVST